MKTKEELCTLKEEALEQVTGGKITTEDDPNNPSNPGNQGNPDSPGGGMNENDCIYFSTDSCSGIARCSNSIAGRTKPECASCPAQGVFLR